MKTYVIIAHCDPHNAPKHYNGQKVLRYEGTTPVEWVMADDLTEAQAISLMMKYAREDLSKTYIQYYDKQVIETEKDVIHNEFKRVLTDEDYAWYKGPGFYAGKEPVYLEGWKEYSWDSMTYKIFLKVQLPFKNQK